MNINIEQMLQERFSAPLNVGQKRRILFWQDPDGGCSEQVDGLDLPGVKVLKLTGTNCFEAKRLLSDADPESNYLVYNPISYMDRREDWLIDIELYSEEFRVDKISNQMQALGLPDTVPLRNAMRTNGKFFENKERFAKLAVLGSCDTVEQFLLNIYAVLTGTANNTFAGVLLALLSGGFDTAENTGAGNIAKYSDGACLAEIVQRYTGYAYEGIPSLSTLASHVLLTALSATMPSSCLRGLEPWISVRHRQYCYSIVSEWMHTDPNALYEIARAVEEERHLVKYFDTVEIADLVTSAVFPCVDECILYRYMTEIIDDVVKADEIIATIEKRRALLWYDRVRNYYDGLLQVSRMWKFREAHADGFHIAEYGELFQAYCDDYYLMDSYYRQFHIAFRATLQEPTVRLEDLYKTVAEKVENLYKNWFLSSLGSQWTDLISEEVQNGAKLEGVPQQKDFYREHVKRIVAGGSRAFVIISDALRYEVARELTEVLRRETRGVAEISAMQSVFPSVTKYGMAALLPHRQLELTREMKVTCDGASTEGTQNRERILDAALAGSVALTAESVFSMKQAERRERIADANVVYIYHNTIDAIGDKPATEAQVFDACESAIREIKSLVRLIINDMNGTNILITADHGFLYSYRPLPESDKVEKSLVSGHVLELDRRYVITDGDAGAAYLLKIPMKHVGSSCYGFTPRSDIRIKKQGGGCNYVHGGISLEECVVPLIEFKNLRAGSKKYVDIKPAEIRLYSAGRKISNTIFHLDFYQKDAVGGKVVAAIYEVYMADEAGAPVSDRVTIIADKTAAEETARVFRAQFNLRAMVFDKTKSYYLTVTEKNTSRVVERLEFIINITFTDDFGI